MRLALISDIHGSTGKVALFAKEIEGFSPDLVVLAGDITLFMRISSSSFSISALASSMIARPFKITPPGNCIPSNLEMF
jgi:Icc-related predicted phosphoesterase